jgi:hypothetical protein
VSKLMEVPPLAMMAEMSSSSPTTSAPVVHKCAQTQATTQSEDGTGQPVAGGNSTPLAP